MMTSLSASLPRVAIASLVFSFASFASNPPPELKAKFCERHRHPEILQRMAIEDSSNRPYIRNQSGPYGWGMCWWYARFFRAAHHLISYRPDLPPPTTEDVKKIFWDVVDSRRVVEVGMSPEDGLYVLTDEHSDLFDELIETWMKRELWLQHRWRHAFKDGETPQKEFARQMTRLEHRVNTLKEMPLILVKFPGSIDRIHAVVAVGLRKDYFGNSLVDFFDPNKPWRILTATVSPRDSWIDLRPDEYSDWKGPFYFEFDDELGKIKRRIADYCE